MELDGLNSDPATAANWRLSSFENGSPDSVRSADALTAEEWQGLQFTAAELSRPEVSDLSSDPDRDGLSNLLEFGLNTLPLKAEATPFRSEIEMIAVSGVTQAYLTLTFNRPANSELYYSLQASSNLSEWKTRPLICVRSSVDPETQIETLTVREKQPVAERGQESDNFLRIRVRR